MHSSTGRPVSHERWRLTALWSGLLAGPLVALMLQQFNYVMSYVACETRQTWFLHLATAVSVGIVAAIAVFAWRASDGHPLEEEHPTHPLEDETRRQRTRWMSGFGVGLSLLSILVILSMEVPVIVLRTCQ
jgi:MFS superfamily sulfate permease-like transporter